MTATGNHTQEKTTRSREWAIVAALTALAAAVRLIGLNQGLWYDEIFSLLRFFRAPLWTLVTGMPDPNHHPLYSLLGKLCLNALGDSEWALRLPSFIAGTASVPLLYFLGSRLINRAVGITASILLIVSFWPVWFSQDARGYALEIFFSIISWGMFLIVLRKWSLFYAAIYVVSTAAMVYSHLYSCFMPLGHLAAALFLTFFKKGLGVDQNETTAGKAALTAAASLALASALYLPMASDFLNFSRSEGQRTMGRAMDLSFLTSLLVNWSAGPGRTLLSIPALAAAAAGVVFTAKENREVLISWALPLSLGFAAPLITGTFTYHRFYCFAMPGFILFMALGLVRLAGKAKRPAPAMAAATALIVLTFLPSLYEYNKIGKQGLKRAAEWARTEAPDSRVLAMGLSGVVFRHYCPRAAPVYPRGPISRDVVRGAVVVITHPYSVGKENLALLSDNCREPMVIKSAGYEENEVRIYDCR